MRSGQERPPDSPLGLVGRELFSRGRCASRPSQLRRPFNPGGQGVAVRGVVVGCARFCSKMLASHDCVGVLEFIVGDASMRHGV